MLEGFALAPEKVLQEVENTHDKSRLLNFGFQKVPIN